MAKVVWRKEEEIKAFGIGSDAAAQGRSRTPPPTLRTYNERAAFNDGWDSFPGYWPRVHDRGGPAKGS